MDQVGLPVDPNLKLNKPLPDASSLQEGVQLVSSSFPEAKTPLLHLGTCHHARTTGAAGTEATFSIVEWKDEWMDCLSSFQHIDEILGILVEWINKFNPIDNGTKLLALQL